MSKTILSDETRAVLERSAITETTVTLPEQLERTLYMKVNQVLTNAGGRWNRKAKAHVFDRDPRLALGLALKNGVSVDEKQIAQAFFTPPELSIRLVETIGVVGLKVLEPSAGEGALVHAALRQGAASVTCFEKEQRFYDVLIQDTEMLGKCLVYHTDFLEVRPPLFVPAMFDRVAMNPPFTKGQDVKHIRHAQQFLRPGGLLGAICANGPRQRDELKSEVIEWIDLPTGSFKRSGTGVNTAMVVLGARR